MAEANLGVGSKHTLSATPTTESMASKKRSCLVAQVIKEPASLPAKMAQQMCHFKFSGTGSPKRKARLPKRRGEPAEGNVLIFISALTSRYKMSYYLCRC